jgi:hypothetical protein
MCDEEVLDDLLAHKRQSFILTTESKTRGVTGKGPLKAYLQRV